MSQVVDKKALTDWDDYVKGLLRATVVDQSETAEQKQTRIQRLERPGNDEEWFKYYFPNYYYAEPAPFHKRSTKLVMENPELYLVRAWSRELAKSARTMMEVTKLALTKKKRSVLLISSNSDTATRLLKPYKINFEKNQRIINDYGKQESYGEWSESAFVIKAGCSFIAIGAGQPPRGLRNEEVRPDVVLMDDFDTDEECRNPDIITNKWNWFEQAVYATRSISNPMLIIFCGNIIADNCCIKLAIEMSDHHEIINIRDEYGNSTWPNKNTEELIDRVLSKISHASQQKEYFNNPMTKGKTFTEIHYGKAPHVKTCRFVVVYADPSTSNKEKNGKSKASTKAVIIVGLKDFCYYIYKIWLDQTTNSIFVDWLFEADAFLTLNQVDPKRIFIENNSLQDPFYQQVILPLIAQRAKEKGRATMPPIAPDSRKKPDKNERVEGTLQPVDAIGNLVFDEKLKGNPHMKRMEQQMLSVSPTATMIDGPDALEGAVWIIKDRVHSNNADNTTSTKYTARNNKRR